MQAHGFAHTPPDPVAHHRLAERARRGETDSRTVGLRLPHAERRKEGARKTGPLIVDSAEIRGSQQNMKWILALALGILALGFIVLYRAQPAAAAPGPTAKGKNERGRR